MSNKLPFQVFLRSGQLTIYEAFPLGQNPETPANPRATTLQIKFAKIASKTFEIQRPEENEKSHILAEQKKVNRLFIPFVTSPMPGITYSGVFFTGDRPHWILATDRGGVQLYPSGHNVVHAFTSCSLWDSRGDFLMYTEEVCFPNDPTLRSHSSTRFVLFVITGSNPGRMGFWLPI